MKKNRILVVVLAIGMLVWYRQTQSPSTTIMHQLTGTTMGTIQYAIKYMGADAQSYQREVDSILVAFNQSLSTYIPDSEISRLNQNDTLTYESPLVYQMLEMSKVMFENSHGAYDPTVGPLVNAWGFGPQKKLTLDSILVDSLLRVVGFEQVVFDEHQVKIPPHTYLDFSASAKGYALDVIAGFFEQHHIEHYMIEIGGEVRCQGQNQHGAVWKIGIEKPEMSQTIGNPYAAVFVKDRSLATSGNYRNYYNENGRIITHTISPYTGYTVTHNLLSASIFAPNCALADGYATACMVLGLESSIEMIEGMEGIDAFFIYSEEDGTLKSYATAGIRTQIELL